MTTIKINVVEADALRVKPDEVLILRIPAEADQDYIQACADALASVGLAGRSLVLGGDVELVVVSEAAGERVRKDLGDPAAGAADTA